MIATDDEVRVWLVNGLWVESGPGKMMGRYNFTLFYEAGMCIHTYVHVDIK